MNKGAAELDRTIIEAKFELADVDIAFSSCSDATVSKIHVDSLACTEGRRETFVSEMSETSIFEYQFTFVSGKAPDEMTATEHFTIITGTLPSGQRVSIRGPAWPFIDQAAGVIDGFFATPPQIFTVGNNQAR